MPRRPAARPTVPAMYLPRRVIAASANTSGIWRVPWGGAWPIRHASWWGRHESGGDDVPYRSRRLGCVVRPAAGLVPMAVFTTDDAAMAGRLANHAAAVAALVGYP